MLAAAITEAQVGSRYDELRMSLLANAAAMLCFTMFIVRESHLTEIIGIVVKLHELLALCVLYMFHRCNKAEFAMRCVEGSDGTRGTFTPPCDGACGTGGSSQAFVFFAIANLVYIHTLEMLENPFAFGTSKLKITNDIYIEWYVAGFAMAISLFFIELGKRSRASRDFLL